MRTLGHGGLGSQTGSVMPLTVGSLDSRGVRLGAVRSVWVLTIEMAAVRSGN